MVRRVTHAMRLTANALMANPDTNHHGYALTAATGLRSGAVHPILHRLTEDGWLEDLGLSDDSGRPRRYYRVTDLGRTELAAIVEDTRKRFPNIGGQT